MRISKWRFLTAFSTRPQREYLEIAFRYLAVKETTHKYAIGHLRRPRDNFTTAANLCNLLRELRIGTDISLGYECAGERWSESCGMCFGLMGTRSLWCKVAIVGIRLGMVVVEVTMCLHGL